MRASILAVAALVAALALPAGAQQGTYRPWTQPGGGDVPGLVMLCATGVGREAAPCGSPDTPLPVLGMPFKRTGDPFLLPATTTPQQYQITQPAGTQSYRGVNPCSVDIRIKTVASLSDTVTATTGTRFLARTAETLASSSAMTSPRIVSIMTVGDPGAGGCTFELGYGNGG